MTSRTTHTLRVLAWQVFLLLGAQVAAVAQQATPVQSLGESSPGLALPLPVQSTDLRKESMDLRSASAAEEPGMMPGATPAGAVAPTNASLVPWWEGQAAVAEHSMDVSPFKLGANLLSGWEYDDNVYLSGIVDGKAHSIFVRPSVSFAYDGAKVKASAAYSGQYRRYDNSEMDDTFNQIFSGGIDYNGAKFKSGLAVMFAETDNGNIEAGARAKSTNLDVAHNSSYEISTKTTLGTTLFWKKTDYDAYIDNERYGAKAFADYKLTPKTSVGLSGGYEEVDVSEGADSIAYELLIRTSLKVSEKIKLRGNAGYEDREYDGGTSRSAPIFSVGFLYNPTETTSLSMDGYRRNNPSITAANQSYYATGVAVNFTQTVYGKVQLGLTGGYEYADYASSVSDGASNREDNYWFVRPNIAYSIRDWLAFNLYYQHSENDSDSTSAHSFERNLIGANVAVSF